MLGAEKSDSAATSSYFIDIDSINTKMNEDYYDESSTHMLRITTCWFNH